MATRWPPRSAARIKDGHIGSRYAVRVPSLVQCLIPGRASMAQLSKVGMQLPHHGIVPPVGMISKVGHHGRTLGHLADAFERLVLMQAAQLRKPNSLGFFVQKIATENPDQFRFCEERGECQKHKATFRTVSAPFLSSRRARLSESRVATTEHPKVFSMLREAPSDFDL